MRSYEGFVRSGELCSPLEGVKIQVIDRSKNVIIETYSNQDGYWKLDEISDDSEISFTKQYYVKKTCKANQLTNMIRLLEDKLIGYQDKLWFKPGEVVMVYVHSPEEFSARLFRHGFEKKCILSLGNFNRCEQGLPDGFFVDKGLEWTVSFCYKIPEDSQPGIYSLLLEAIGEEDFAIPFIVSSPEDKCGLNPPLLVLASTNTWQSYNLWGGRSRYRNFEDSLSKDYINIGYDISIVKKILGIIPKGVKNQIKRMIGYKKEDINPSEEWIYRKLTIKRPFTNCNLEGKTAFEPFTNHLAAGEWRLLAWMEREGISYDIISGAELHSCGQVLENYKAVVFNTHCEYWTKEMYKAVKSFHDKGGWILNLSGNTMYREIEFFEDGSTRCVSTSFAKSCADETQILGVRFSDPDYGTCAPFKVLDEKHWVFKGTSVSRNSLFGVSSLNQNTERKYKRYDPGRPGVAKGLKGMGASGWETDKLSKTAPADMKVIAKGMNKSGGADMLIREPSANRGGMFSVSSVVFNGSLIIDDICSKIVKNVISKVLYNDD